MVSRYFQGHRHFFALQPTFRCLAQDETSWCSLTYSPSPFNENSRGGVGHGLGSGEGDLSAMLRFGTGALYGREMGYLRGEAFSSSC